MTVNVVPRPVPGEVTSIDPRWALTIPCAIVSPIPVPPGVDRSAR